MAKKTPDSGGSETALSSTPTFKSEASAEPRQEGPEKEPSKYKFGYMPQRAGRKLNAGIGGACS